MPLGFFSMGDLIITTREVEATLPLPGGERDAVLPVGEVYRYEGNIPGTDLHKLTHLNNTENGLSSTGPTYTTGPTYIVSYVRFLYPPSFALLPLTAARAAGRGGRAPAPTTPANNDGRAYCFDAGCGGKTKRVDAGVCHFDVCTRCGK